MATRRIRPAERGEKFSTWIDMDSVLGNVLVIDIWGANGGNTEVVLPLASHRVAEELAWGAAQSLIEIEAAIEKSKERVRDSLEGVI